MLWTCLGRFFFFFIFLKETLSSEIHWRQYIFFLINSFFKQIVNYSFIKAHAFKSGHISLLRFFLIQLKIKTHVGRQIKTWCLDKFMSNMIHSSVTRWILLYSLQCTVNFTRYVLAFSYNSNWKVILSWLAF